MKPLHLKKARNRPSPSQTVNRGLIAIIFASIAAYLVVRGLSLPLNKASTISSTSLVDVWGAPSVGASASVHANILLVSAFFHLPKSKHSMDDYQKWLALFLQHITTDVYFYTSPDLEALVRRVRGPLPITINTTFSSPFDIPPLRGLESKYTEMHEWDREQTRHSPQLYAVWNAKPYLLDEAVRTSHRVYDYAFWNDAGSFRNRHTYGKWPDPGRVERIWEAGSVLSGTRKEDPMFIPIQGVPHVTMRHWDETLGPIDNEFSEGSFRLPLFRLNEVTDAMTLRNVLWWITTIHWVVASAILCLPRLLLVPAHLHRERSNPYQFPAPPLPFSRHYCMAQ